VGAYATYLNGGLFIDALVKDDILTLKSDESSGLPASLNVNNIGFRIDSGYRFGGFGPGMFFEPLATISAVDSEFDDFAKDGNSVKFGDSTSVRGRLGARLGMSFMAAPEITVEPFVIGSVWHEFEDNNQAVLVATGASTATFNLLDDLEGTWAEISAGVNVFNVGAGASGFAKVDVAVGDDIGGVGGQAGMRVRW
jgi:outer membrane autotransporter protein